MELLTSPEVWIALLTHRHRGRREAGGLGPHHVIDRHATLKGRLTALGGRRRLGRLTTSRLSTAPALVDGALDRKRASAA